MKPWLLVGLGVCLLAGCAPQPASLAQPLELPIPLAGDDIWQPAVGSTWQWQLSGAFDSSVEAQVYDLDLFDTPASTVKALHTQGAHVICYLNAGSWEDWRPDAADFPEEVIGRKYSGWPGERWLDIRRMDVLAPIMEARLDLCAAKGFDGVEPDNVDGYGAATGFPLSEVDQLAYNAWLANAAHQRGLAIGLKNNPEQALDLLPYFDFAVTEDYFDQGWCGKMSPFIEQGKPVFAAEYTDSGAALDEICPQAGALQFSLILKRRGLDAWRAECP
ncbi:MAG: endo alpha-1,4 polygalactosaminidase [Anaerolineaceae bacterium]|jgi:hypothetical protein|nr:endo alpha-1,4 polygalactosaminidase [Anaerolineaceae bacterium]